MRVVVAVATAEGLRMPKKYSTWPRVPQGAIEFLVRSWLVAVVDSCCYLLVATRSS